MNIEIGSIAMAIVTFLGAFATSILYAAGARSDAKKANEQVIVLRGEVAKLEARHESLDSKIVQELGAIKIALGRIQGRLGVDGEL